MTTFKTYEQLTEVEKKLVYSQWIEFMKRRQRQLARAKQKRETDAQMREWARAHGFGGDTNEDMDEGEDTE